MMHHSNPSQVFRITFMILLLAVTLPSPAGASRSLTPLEIEQLSTQLTEAREVGGTLEARLQCHKEKDDVLQARSRELQETVGKLLRDEKNQSGKVAEAEYKADEYLRESEGAEQEVMRLEEEIHGIEKKIRSKQAELDKCKKVTWIFNFMCDAGDKLGEVLGLNKTKSRLESEAREVYTRGRSKQEQYEAARNDYLKAAGELGETRSRLEQTQTEIETAEAEIKVIKASLLEIRTVKQAYSDQLSKFRETLAEFQGLDPESDRRSVVRRLRRESVALDGQLAEARVMLAENGSELPNGERICAN